MSVRKKISSLDEIFNLHHRSVYRIAYSVMRDSGLAEDITQEVFVRLYRNFDLFEGDEVLRPWLLRQAWVVSRNKLQGLNQSQERDDTSAKSTFDSLFPPNSDEEHLRRVAIEKARQALDTLPKAMKNALLL